MQELRDKFPPARARQVLRDAAKVLEDIAGTDTGPIDDLEQMLAELKNTQAKQTSAKRRAFLQPAIDEIQALINSHTGVN